MGSLNNFGWSFNFRLGSFTNPGSLFNYRPRSFNNQSALFNSTQNCSAPEQLSAFRNLNRKSILKKSQNTMCVRLFFLYSSIRKTEFSRCGVYYIELEVLA